MSKLYYDDELDMGIMAKLLILHKLNQDLFMQLNKWNANYNLESDVGNEQYKLMRQGLETMDTDSEYHKWYKPQIKAWVNCQPVELEKENLDKYFYLTREILTRTEELESNISEASKNILERIGTVSQGLAPKLIDDIADLGESDFSDVMSIVTKRIEKGNVESYFYALLFIRFEGSRREMKDAILKQDKKIEPGDLAVLKTIHNADEDLLPLLLEDLVISKRMNHRMMNTIVKGEN